MPPKRRKASPSAPAVEPEPAPKKRVTRSSARPNPATHGTPPPTKTDSPKPETKASKPSARKNKEYPKAKQVKKSPPQNTTNTNGPVTELSLTHSGLKNPIPCHAYIPPADTTSATPTLIFTHGAGGTLSADAVVNFCTGYAESSPVLAFQGSMNLGARVKGFHASVGHLEEERKIGDWGYVLGGRSMGARAAVVAATEMLGEDDDDDAAKKKDVSVILVSYPLKGPQGDLRDKILLELPDTARVLFIIGDRDTMCPLDTLEDVRKKMQSKNSLIVIRGADHGMHVKPVALERELGREGGRLAAAWVAGTMEEQEVYIGTEK